MVPEGWEEQTLGEWIVEHQEKSTELNQHTVLTSSRSGLIPQSEYYGDSRISQRENIGFHVIPPGFITYRSRSDDGLFFFNRNDTGDTGIISHFYPVFRFPAGSDQFFLSLINYQRHRFFGHSVGTSQKVLSMTALKKMKFAIPPLPEQRKIAEILSTWDRAIETAQALLATARRQKRALMQSLLTGKRRFPEFDGQEWKEVRLGQMGQTVSGGTPESSKGMYWDGDVHWATPTDITKLKSRFIRGTARMITQAGLKSSSAKMIPAGSILICTRATIGQMAITTGPICTNQGFKNLVLSDDFDSDFVFYLLQYFKNELVRYACGSTFLELSKKDFDKRSFSVPSLSEQLSIAAVLNAAEEEIDEHRQSIDKLRTEKKALMQQLLTGKRRVVLT
ncbi:restriction endonuclease subunit S [Pseudophaeobacter sp.]|uniref:restriction endonuclease subunit S n=1 Tax=Pseudophaeobacter sp. TaxID=1971739 RepID=UPI002617C5D4|nr:restriction endonuclease subunit S [Pseudophaeobacter sp.]